ncbi:MAG: uracil-DNA glycosylase family protein [Bacteroidaceae bacterium]|nr:uracil-DNA glycosylase family protein [Bacteroidaceae bacterium]
MDKKTEKHPLEPFLPQNARILMLGSFPPPRARWSMEFFYPNWQNDMWFLMGLLFFDDRNHFRFKEEKRFDKETVVEFCNSKGIALYDTACEVVRLKENASDKFLEIETATDIEALLEKLPCCTAIVTTGQKATDTIVKRFGCTQPVMGSKSTLRIGERTYNFWRMPSTSRAYPLALEKKAAYYQSMFLHEGMSL